MKTEREKFIQKRNKLSERKCTEKLLKFEYFDISKLPSAADDAAEVMRKVKI